MPSFKIKFSGVTILQGVEFSIFPIDFEWVLQQCSATALPVIYKKPQIHTFCQNSPLPRKTVNNWAWQFVVSSHVLVGAKS